VALEEIKKKQGILYEQEIFEPCLRSFKECNYFLQ
jgi:hypothetical protein